MYNALTPDLIEHIKEEYPEHLEMLTTEVDTHEPIPESLMVAAQEYFGDIYDDENGEVFAVMHWVWTDIIQFATEQSVPWLMALRAFSGHRVNRRIQKRALRRRQA